LLAGLQSNYMKRMWLVVVVNIDIKEKLPYRTHWVGCVIPMLGRHNDNQDVTVTTLVADDDVWVTSPGKYA
jgi:hypothetical protein